MSIVFLVGALVVIGIVGAFLRAVFGGTTFRRQRRRKGDRGSDGRGPRADAHAGASNWTGGGGFGRWGTWNDG